eukprot:scaffold53552_cov66-Phaeocystis_antarctica.AAC.3
MEVLSARLFCPRSVSAIRTPSTSCAPYGRTGPVNGVEAGGTLFVDTSRTMLYGGRGAQLHKVLEPAAAAVLAVYYCLVSARSGLPRQYGPPYSDLTIWSGAFCLSGASVSGALSKIHMSLSMCSHGRRGEARYLEDHLHRLTYMVKGHTESAILEAVSSSTRGSG